MKIQTKFALYSAASKVLIILAISVTIPSIISTVVYTHIDSRLKARTDRVFKMIERGGIDEITLEQDCSFESYNILKEEFVSIEPLTKIDKGSAGTAKISNDEISIEEEILLHRVISQPFLYDNQLYELRIGEGLGAIEELNHSIRKFTFWITLILILLTIIADIGFTKVLLKPFHKIIDTKLKPAIHPTDYVASIIPTNTDEFALLDNSINGVMQKAKELFIIEKEFIGNVSHELLTPISVLQSRLENMLAENNLPSSANIKLVESQRTLSRLSKVIKALLMISQIENDQFLKKESVAVSELVNEVVSEIEERAAEKKITIENNLKSDFQLTECNRSLLFTMLFNVVSNAAKFSESGQTIVITDDSDEASNYMLTITDKGAGINSEHFERIFDRFKRFDRSSKEGYGLGLPIVKKIAEFHKIKLHLKSEMGQGTAFTFIFPTV